MFWDEMAFMLRNDTNLRFNYLALMALAGATAATGLWSDTLHLVVGAMVIAPAFEPLVRVPFGMITRSADVVKRGLISAGAGYLMLLLGSLLATLLLRVLIQEKHRLWRLTRGCSTGPASPPPGCSPQSWGVLQGRWL